MYRVGVYFGLLLTVGVGCGESPGLPGAPCVLSSDCGSDQVCEEGSCQAENPRIPIGGTGVLYTTDAGSSADAGTVIAVDAGASDFGSVVVDVGSSTVDAGVSSLDAGPTDLGASDSGADDAGVADVGSVDLGPADAGATAGTDAGVGPVAAGRYQWRRVLVSGIASSEGLWRVAVSPDGTTLAAAAYANRIHIIDLATETLVRTLTLSAAGASAVRIGDMAYAPSGDFILVAATTVVGSRLDGRLYLIENGGSKVSSAGTSNGMQLQRIVFRGSTDVADVLGYEDLGTGSYVLGLHHYDRSARTFTYDQGATAQAGCEGLARADDGLGGTARVFSCGIGGGDIGHVDTTGTLTRGPGAGNVSHLDGHPGGGYALGVAWSSSRLIRFEQGRWTTGTSAPDLGTAQLSKLEMSSDGSRGLIVGGYERTSRRLELREYRDGAYSSAGISNISIAGFDSAPWLGTNGTGFFDAAWMPGCDEGWVVGGCGSVDCGRGWLAHFEVSNGRSCAAP